MALDPYRMIAGETTAQRAARIRAETGASPFASLPMQAGQAPQTFTQGAMFPLTTAPIAPQGANEGALAYNLRNLFQGVGRGVATGAESLLNLPVAAQQDYQRLWTQPATDAMNGLVTAAMETPHEAALRQNLMTPVTANPFAMPGRINMTTPASASGAAAFDPADPMGIRAQMRPQTPGLNDVVAAFGKLGITPTSSTRTPQHNQEVGGVRNSMHLAGPDGLGQAVDLPKTKGMTKEQAVQIAAAAGVSVTEALDEGDHFHIGWRPKGAAASDVASNFGNPFSAAAPFLQQAMGQLDQSEAAAKQPFEVSYTPNAAPEMPKPQMSAPTDWTASDKALDAMRPVEMLQRDKLKLEREGYFRGIGQALMNIPDGAGLGKTLAALGGGALAGVGAAKAEIRDRMDMFDRQMASFHAAQYSNETQKAQTAHAEAEHNLQAMNTYALRDWQVKLDKFNKENFVTADGNGVTISRTGADGKVTLRTVPNAAAITAGMAMKRATLLSGIADNAQQGAAAQMSPANTLMTYQLLNSGNGASQEENLAQLPFVLAGAAVEGGYALNLFGGADSEDAKKASQEAMRRAGLMAPPSNKDEYDRYDRAMAGLIGETAANPSAKTFRDQLMQYGSFGRGISGAFAQRTQTTDSRGRSTTKVQQ